MHQSPIIILSYRYVHSTHSIYRRMRTAILVLLNPGVTYFSHEETVERCKTINIGGSRIFIFNGGGGGGGSNRLCASTHITSAEPYSLSTGCFNDLSCSSVASFLVWVGGGGKTPKCTDKNNIGTYIARAKRASASETYVFRTQNTSAYTMSYTINAFSFNYLWYGAIYTT